MSRAILPLLGAILVLLAACSSPERAEDTVNPTVVDSVGQPTATAPPTQTSTQEPSATPSPTATVTATSTPTPSPTPTPTPTATPEPTASPTPEPPTLTISDLSLQDIDGSPLEFLSIDEHGLFGGFTPIHGAMAIEGEGEIASVSLEISDDATGAVVTTSLAAAAAEQLILPLGEPGRLAVPAGQLLFEIPSGAFAEFDRSEDGYVELLVRVTATDGREAVYQSPQMRSLGKLVLYTADNRYFVGEEAQGGNSWATPDTKAFAEQLPDVQYGDFSNMNGGYFPPHISHQRGVDFDAWFEGYNNLDAGAAQGLLERLNHPGVIERVELVFVTYVRDAGDPFWEAIRDMRLVDGRLAAAVFYPEPEHTGHFHVRLWE